MRWAVVASLQDHDYEIVAPSGISLGKRANVRGVIRRPTTAGPTPVRPRAERAGASPWLPLTSADGMTLFVVRRGEGIQLIGHLPTPPLDAVNRIPVPVTWMFAFEIPRAQLIDATRRIAAGDTAVNLGRFGEFFRPDQGHVVLWVDGRYVECGVTTGIPFTTEEFGRLTSGLHGLPALTSARYGDAMARIAQLAPRITGWGEPHRGWTGAPSSSERSCAVLLKRAGRSARCWVARTRSGRTPLDRVKVARLERGVKRRASPARGLRSRRRV
jgi:hypothetical protein